MIMKINKILGLLILVAAFSIVLIGNGITGYVVNSSTVREICSAEMPCQKPDVCCMFYGEDQGVCHSKGMCPRILELTKNEKMQIEELNDMLDEQDKATAGYVLENDLKESYMTQFTIGGAMLIFIIITIVIYMKNHQVSSKQAKKKKSASS